MEKQIETTLYDSDFEEKKNLDLPINKIGNKKPKTFFSSEKNS